MVVLSWRRQRILPALLTCAAIACRTTEPAPDDGDTPAPRPLNTSRPGTTPVSDPTVDVTSEAQGYGGGTRLYLLGKPRNYDPKKSYPLVLSFHGNPGRAQDMARLIPFHTVSKDEAIVVYPQAATSDWDLYTPTDDNADMNWIAQLPAEIKRKLNVDLKRVYGFGYSGGGFFLTQFSCRFGDVFKGISSNAGGGPDEEAMGFPTRNDGCFICPGGPTAILVTHGESDGTVDPESGAFTKNCYAGTNGCSGGEEATSPDPCVAFRGCPKNKPVKWCLVPGLGHGIWGNAVGEAWSFFNALP